MSKERTIIERMKKTIESFLNLFEEYAQEVYEDHPQQARLDELRSQLQRREPQVTRYLLDVLGDGVIALRHAHIYVRDLIANGLLGGENELPINFHQYHTTITAHANRVLGTLESGLWPPKPPKPVLTIKDTQLQEYCSDLLRAPGVYDRVIREATTVLEDRMRQKCGHNLLAQLIPNAPDQTGEKLVNKLFSPNDPVLSISNDRHQRILFHKALLAAVSYLRNPYHHQIDPTTEWSWAWSAVGFIDRLIADIDACIRTRD